MRHLRLPALGVIVAALTLPPGTLAAPAQLQPAVAFDQIDRVLIQGATPPPIDSFTADAATIATLPSIQLNSSGSTGVAQGIGMTLVSAALGFIPFVGGFIAGAASQAANAAAQAAQRHQQEEHNAAVMHFITAGSLSHFAFYHGWLRAEHAGNDATIVKPDQGVTIVLDLQKKTARTIDTRANETITVDTQDNAPPELVGEPATERLPTATIAGLAARGYRTSATLELKQGLGWCHAGRHAVTQVEYVTDQADPQPITTAAALRGLADVCQPASTLSYREPGRLVVYRATSVDAGTANAVSIMFERANVRALDDRSASLFSIPSDFVQEH